MKRSSFLVCLCTVSLATATFAQDAYKAVRTSSATTEEKTARDLFQVRAAYVFESDLENDDDNIHYGKQDAFQGGVEYSHRFLLSGHVYLRAGIGYDRFDFGDSLAPVPDQLFSLTGIIALEYMMGNDAGAFIELRPGFYTEDHFGMSSFDVPITAGRAFVLQRDKLYLFVGANAAFLRGQLPVLPFIGLVWRPNEQWTVYGVAPEPRLIYCPNKSFSLWVGGQLTGGSFRTDEDDTIVPHKLSNAAVDYTEYQAGGGIDYHPCDAISVRLGGGYAIQRRFNFERAGEDYEADPAPYLRLMVKAEF